MPSRLNVETDTLTDRYGKFYAAAVRTRIRHDDRKLDPAGFALLDRRSGGNRRQDRRRRARILVDQRRGRRCHRRYSEPQAGSVPLHGGRTSKTLTISKKGAGEVTSADIETDGDVEVLDKSVHIATISGAGSFNVEMRLKRGRGYVSAELNNDEDLSVGYIPIDSVHTPIKKVNYNVDKTRQGSNTEFDKLTIEVWTDGSVKPEDSIGLAAKLVKDHMSIFINFEEEEEEYKYEDIARPPLMRNDLLDKPVDELELSVRSYNCLKNADIRSIRDLIRRSEKDMLAHQELRQEVADRDQGHAARNGTRFWNGL